MEAIVKQRQTIVECALPLRLGGRMKKFWLVKQEPSAYSWSDFKKDGRTNWTGVRNYTARNNLRAMRRGKRAHVFMKRARAFSGRRRVVIERKRHA